MASESLLCLCDCASVLLLGRLRFALRFREFASLRPAGSGHPIRFGRQGKAAPRNTEAGVTLTTDFTSAEPLPGYCLHARARLHAVSIFCILGQAYPHRALQQTSCRQAVRIHNNAPQFLYEGVDSAETTADVADAADVADVPRCLAPDEPQALGRVGSGAESLPLWHRGAQCAASIRAFWHAKPQATETCAPCARMHACVRGVRGPRGGMGVSAVAPRLLALWAAIAAAVDPETSCRHIATMAALVACAFVRGSGDRPRRRCCRGPRALGCGSCLSGHSGSPFRRRLWLEVAHGVGVFAL